MSRRATAVNIPGQRRETECRNFFRCDGSRVTPSSVVNARPAVNGPVNRPSTALVRSPRRSTTHARTRILDGIIENVSQPASALVPLFRSEQQLRILAVLFGEGAEDLTIGDLAQRAGVAQATASREVARLAEHGLVETRSLGRNTLVTANWRLPWARELRSILVQTVGVVGRLASALRGLSGVEEAFVFGSWAARHAGTPGPAPRDIDVAVIGDVPLRAVRRVCREIEGDLRVEINPVVIDRDQWADDTPEPFVAQLKAQPRVAIPLEQP